MADKRFCRFCGKEVKGSGKAIRHAEPDASGNCEARRRIITGDPRTPIEVA